jgi:hypothetical protein
MSRSSATALAIGEGPDIEPAEEPRRLKSIEANDDSQVLETPEAARQRPKEEVPRSARLWGFVRHLTLGEILNAEASKNAAPTENDATLWWDADRHRFLIVSENLIIDDLSPLQFVQFVRELRDVTSRILFKFERRQDGSTGRAYRVWAP